MTAFVTALVGLALVSVAAVGLAVYTITNALRDFTQAGEDDA